MLFVSDKQIIDSIMFESKAVCRDYIVLSSNIGLFVEAV